MENPPPPSPNRAAGTQQAPTPRGLLGRLRRDTAGNTLAIAAAALIPLILFSGSAIDMARLNVVQVRLQQSCDAGVLAGRKFMADNTSTTLDDNAKTQAQNFFTNNFKAGWFSNQSPVFTPTKVLVNSTYQVAGTANVQVPMTIMAIFGMPTRTIAVKCQASFDTPDTDVMFVLDTTGSMACLPSDSSTACSTYVGTASGQSYTRSDGTTGYYVKEKTGSRIESLRQAVLTFYDTVAGSVDASTHVRYGFVPYTSTVNVGFDLRDMSSDYLAKSWSYWSRYPSGDYQITLKSTSNATAASVTECTAKYSRNPSTKWTYASDGTATDVNPVWNPTLKTCTLQNRTVGPIWTYGPTTYDTTDFIKNTSNVTDPSKVDSSKSDKWQGCIEERQTTMGATSFNIASLPNDLNPDLVPSATDVTTQWKPMWQDVIYLKAKDSTTNGDTNANPIDTATYAKAGYFSCGKQAKRLFTPTTGTAGRQQIYDYVYSTDFKALGGTYHDDGMIWGTRMISPNGIFKADTAAWPNRKTPHRMIVFMTDGDMAPNSSIYGLYGVEDYVRRITGTLFGSNDPDAYTQYTDIHNARFLAECAKAKDEGIDVWVVALGQAVTTQLSTCATVPEQALYADSSKTLSDAFTTIAKQVAMLRVSK